MDDINRRICEQMQAHADRRKDDIDRAMHEQIRARTATRDVELDTLKQSIVKVGDGRGFVVQHGIDRLIITAAHCLPAFPPCTMASYTEERTYGKLLGPIGADCEVWAECLFADPISDVAILGMPDNQELIAEADKYERFTETLAPIRIRLPKLNEIVWALSLDGQFSSAIVAGVNDQRIQVRSENEIFKAGMSGSPLLGSDGYAVSVVGLGGNMPEFQMQANLLMCLPGWLTTKGRQKP